MDTKIDILRAENLTYHDKINKFLISVRGKLNNKEQFCLKDISFDLNEREILGIVEQEDSCVSTLLKLVSGQLKPNSGQIIYRNRSVSDEQLKKIVRYISLPDIVMNSNLTLIENILQSFNDSDERSQMIDKMEKMLDDFHIREFEFRELRMLPNDVRNILIMIIGLISIKPILCVRQPLQCINNIHKGIYAKELRNLAANGTSVIITSGSKKDLDLICDRTIELKLPLPI